MSNPSDLDATVRARAFQFLDELRRTHGDALPRDLLVRGFELHGHRVSLLAPQGIFKPAILSMPLSIATAPPSPRKPRPYDDRVGEDGVFHYKYRGDDPAHPDNAGLRRAMGARVPLVYFVGLVPGRYHAEYPVFVVRDDMTHLTFNVQVDDLGLMRAQEISIAGATDDARREYITVLAQRRLHQESFRARVLRAYQECCAVCRLKHTELLEAAHILPDHHREGLPIVRNGLALCKIHHAAFDRNILGIRPDRVIEIRADILREKDGSMLRHGLQDLHGRELEVIPRARDERPDPARLQERYELFKQAG